MRPIHFLNAIKHPLLLALLLPLGESCFGFVGAQVQAKPPGFPDGQTQPKPGPSTGSNTVTLWQLPDDAKAIIQTDSGDLYGIYYSAWSDPSNELPGVSGSNWINDANKYVPWKGNKDLAKELSSKYQLLKDDLLVKSCSIQDQSGSNSTCVDGVENLYLYGYWNGGGFAYESGEDAAKRPTGTPNSKFINYYWNGEVYRTITQNPSYRIQAFAGCKVGAGQTISRGKSVLVSKLGTGDQDCKGDDFIAPVFTGGTLLVDRNGETSQNFYLQDTVGNTIYNIGGSVEFSFSGVLRGPGGMIFEGSGVTALSGDNTYEGPTVVQNGTLRLGSATGIPNISSTSVNSGATLDLNDQKDVRIISLTLVGGTLQNSGVSEASLETGFTLSADSNIDVPDSNASLIVSGAIDGDGFGVTKLGDGTTTFSGKNTYSGATAINAGTLKVSGSLSDSTAVSVSKSATYQVESDDTIGSIAGAGSIQIATGKTLTAGGLNSNTEVSGVMSGGGGFTKVGTGTTTFSGDNTYEGKTTIRDGVLALASGFGIPKASPTLVTGSGHLDLAAFAGDGFEIDDITIQEKGKLSVTAKNPLKVTQFAMNGGEIDAYVFDKDSAAPIQVQSDGEFAYKQGTLNVIADPTDDDPEGSWNIIDGQVTNEKQLAANTVLKVNDEEYRFKGIGEDNAVEGASAVYQGYLKGDSLKLVIEAKDEEQIDCQLYPGSSGCPEPEPEPEIDPGCKDDDCLVGNDLPDVDGDGEPDVIDKDDDNDGIPDHKDPDDDGDGELDALPGCEVGDDLCDIISDIPGDEDEAWEEEEEDAGEIIDALLDGVQDEEIDLAFSFDYGQLARLVGSGLAPRNVDAAGRGLALHNNLLVDAVFERQPLRQFEELVASEAFVEDKAVVEESVVEEEAVIEEAAPVQPLWLKSEELADGEAAEYVEGAVADVKVADAADPEAEAAAGEVSFVDLQDDELDLAKRDGVSAWVKGFGGNSRADDSSILYNDYDLNAYGTSFGVDVALSDSFQIGAYANYGDLNVNQHSGETGGGSWNPEGWGGGLTAQYSTRHFYVQGLLGASEFSGEQSRNILRINENLGGNTARGDKSVTSYLGALRIGAPFKTGGVVLEPQGQVVWTRNQEQGFSETRGTEKNLRLKYKSRTTNFAETELGMKLSVPIRTGERALLVPSVRAAWLADWNQANEGQEIGYKFTNKTANFDSQLGTENGALIEAGLDYTVQNFNGISVKLYGRGGMEFWASDRGTTWRASGGVTFQF